MRYNAINLIHRGADALQKDGDGGSAYALHELANNLLALMTGKATLEAWAGCYVATGCTPMNIDAHMDAMGSRVAVHSDDTNDDASVEGA